MAVKTLYGDKDPRELPLYGISEAAHYLHIPPTTLRSWIIGRAYFSPDGPVASEPLLSCLGPGDRRLSFSNLVEAHVLRALRTQHVVPLGAVRRALRYAEEKLGIERLLLSDQLRTAGGELFLDRFGKLVNLSRSGQLAIKKLLDEHLRRIERDPQHLPVRLFPFPVASLTNAPRWIVIDPRVAFGKPTVADHGISTAAIVRRIDAGESVADLARDYDLLPEQIEAAVVYEQAA